MNPQSYRYLNDEDDTRSVNSWSVPARTVALRRKVPMRPSGGAIAWFVAVAVILFFGLIASFCR